ncbi:SWI5-dependent HO expression protein 4 [Ophidiomyces ophidiicola]|nr:SWI5-dependent HO expression protein 4 [Ophidiomyces ophidiicola]KAI1918368.1 SWI5-dependent HO expression protein 4 [Ophidiomyces ophidiicola]KAI1925824.1 SWI5-dependent HO expression protein 4 [Ophidiomyces ophidiicola]KAI1964242.1 SWI5-dependent HO expression protein 4 [Ophidiomyces ophidiicola]KAI2009260.1 SWI5-dependent HO expression protein 4 [Ophidiomyces ophidiicola]
MVSVIKNDRAALLAREAVELVDAGHREAASRNLREAIALAPESSEVKAAFLKVRDDDENIHPLLTLCRRYLNQQDEDAGKEAVKFLQQEGLETPADAALDSLKLVLGTPASKLSATQDDIISGLVRQSTACRLYFAAELQNSVTHFFDELYDRGDGSVVCLDTVVLEKALWQSDKARSHCESELLQLFIAKLMESGHDHDGRSLKGIARLLAVDAHCLHHLIDEEGFDVILSSLDLRLPVDVRSQATLATAKYLEASGDSGQQFFTNIITSRVAKRRQEDYIIAFSAAAVVFPLLPAIASNLFLSEGFLQSLTPLFYRRQKFSDLELSILELFNAACIDKACREAIDKHHSDWLSHTLSNGTQHAAGLAAVIIAKIQASGKPTEAHPSSKVQEADVESHDLVDRFRQLLAKQSLEDNTGHVVEGLAYSSVRPAVKEQIANDRTFLENLFRVLMNEKEDNTVLYGGLATIWNITKYRPNLSEEQKKLSELKAYANTSKPTQLDTLDDDEHVKHRCTAVIDAGIMPVLVWCGKRRLSSIRTLSAQILLALSKDSKSRGKLAQQGAVGLLVATLNPAGDAPRKLEESSYNAAHALARILISVDPSLVFVTSGFPQITSAIRPLLLLLSPPEVSLTDQSRDLLPVFEGLLALTNLASSPDKDAAVTIVRVGWPTVEDLLLSNHSFIRRSACELVCNLMNCEAGLAKFADGSARAGQRLHILLALGDVEDLPTRRAAGGALAMLTEYESAVSAILDRARGLDIILGLCSDEDEGLVHRGTVCVHHIARATGDVGRKGKHGLLEKGALEALKARIPNVRTPAVMESGIEALKALLN